MPAPAPPIPNCCKITLMTRTKNRPCTNLLYYSVGGGTVVAYPHVKAIADAIDAVFAPLITGVITQECRYLGVRAQIMVAGEATWEAYGTSHAADGALDDDSTDKTLPDEVCAVIQKLTGSGGPAARGRLFLTGLSEDMQDAGVLNGTHQNDLKDLANAIPMDRNVHCDVGDEVEGRDYVLHARHWNRKTSTMMPIVSARVMDVLVSRRDRRRPLVGVPIP